MHPALVLIRGSKYLRVLRAGSHHVLGMEVLPAGGAVLCRAPAEYEGHGAGEADSCCLEGSGPEESLG